MQWLGLGDFGRGKCRGEKREGFRESGARIG